MRQSPPDKLTRLEGISTRFDTSSLPSQGVTDRVVCLVAEPRDTPVEGQREVARVRADHCERVLFSVVGRGYVTGSRYRDGVAFSAAALAQDYRCPARHAGIYVRASADCKPEVPHVSGFAGRAVLLPGAALSQRVAWACGSQASQIDYAAVGVGVGVVVEPPELRTLSLTT